MGLRRLLGIGIRVAGWVEHLHDVAFLQFQIAAGVYDDVREAAAFFSDVVVIDGRQIETVHARANEVRDFGALYHLVVIVSGIVVHRDGELRPGKARTYTSH